MKIDKIIRTSRKTIALIVQRDGQLIIRAPKRATNAEIMRFAEEKAEWIRVKQAEAQARAAQAKPKTYTPGESFLFLGEAYPLVTSTSARASLALADRQFTLKAAALLQAEQLFLAWYKAQARKVFEERARLYAEQFHLSFNKLRISSARTRWGSCSTRGTISFTWRLVMAPLPVIDYVVVHELAHLVERNHSRHFWERVAAMMPDYQQKVRWLKENGHRCRLE